MVTTGCSAAITHATAACVTGGNPDLHVRVPDLRGFPKDECIIPKHSRNVYDAAVRAVGVRVVEVGTAEELEAAFGPRTALVYILAGPERRRGAAQHEGHLRGREEAGRARARGLRGRDPDRAERPPAARRRPRHVQRRQVPARPAGRRPPPRPQGPREGRLGAQRAPPRLRPRGSRSARKRRWRCWRPSRRGRSATTRPRSGCGLAGSTRSRGALAPIDGVTTSVTPLEGLSNRMPLLQIRWDRAKLGTTGEAVAKLLFESEPRISLFPARGKADGNETGLTIGPYMMAPGDEKVVAERLFAVLSKPPRVEEKPHGPAGDGPHRHWDVRIEYAAGVSTHRCTCGSGATTSTAPTRATSCPATCGARSTATRSRSAAPESTATRSATRSPARSTGDEMAGDVSLGEYLDARFTAKRHASGRA